MNDPRFSPDTTDRTANGFWVSGAAGGATAQCVTSTNGYNVTATAGGLRDGFMMYFDVNAACLWASYFGGNADEYPALSSLAAAPNGDVYFVGTTTSSSNFPLVNGGGFYDAVNSSTGGGGFIAKFSRTDRALLWSTFLNAGINGAVVDANGSLFLAGLTTNDLAPLTVYPPYYNQSTLYGSREGLIFAFSADQQLTYGTYFGGDDDVYRDEVTTIERWNDRVYVAGKTGKGQNTTSFFPLYNPGSPAYFDGVYQFIPDAFGNNSDFTNAFVAAFCPNFNIGLSELSTDSPSLRAKYSESNLTLFGLKEPATGYMLFDATGRLIRSQARTLSHPSAIIAIDLAPGVYVIRIQGFNIARSSRFIVTQ